MGIERPCPICARLTKGQRCKDCELHYQRYGHYPSGVWRERDAGQPRSLKRICGLCKRTLGKEP